MYVFYTYLSLCSGAEVLSFQENIDFSTKKRCIGCKQANIYFLVYLLYVHLWKRNYYFNFPYFLLYPFHNYMDKNLIASMVVLSFIVSHFQHWILTSSHLGKQFGYVILEIMPVQKDHITTRWTLRRELEDMKEKSLEQISWEGWLWYSPPFNQTVD